jgi:hypothetical protein
MIMLKKIALLTLLLAALSVPAFAAQAISSSVGVPTADVAVLGTTNGVGCRIYSTFGAETGINVNIATTVPACGNARCLRNYNAAQQIFVCNTENTAPYNADADGQIFYNLIDGEANPGACNHAGFYAFEGMVTNSGAILSPGDFRVDGCPGTTSVNCLERASSADSNATPLANVNAGVQAAHGISSVGGLTPNPTVRVDLSAGNGCGGGVKLTWRDPDSYATNMKNGVPSPLQGVRLYRNNSPCASCPGGSVAAGWTPVGDFGPTAGTAGVCQPVAGDAWYALTVLAKGPGAAPSTIESGVVGGQGFVGANSQCVNTSPTAVRIASVTARYAGRGTVNVAFTTGSEAGVSGFNVQRASSPSGPWTTVGEMVSTRGDGNSYTVTDKVRASLGHVLYYAVQIVMNDGSTVQSGTSAVTLPAVQKKLSPGN